MSRLTWKWQTIFYIVVFSDLFKLSRHRNTQINNHDGTQAKYNRQDIIKVHRQNALLDRRRSWLRKHQWNDATTLRQHSNPFETTRMRTPHAHRQNYEADALHNSHCKKIDEPSQPWSIPHDTYEHHRGPMRTTLTSIWQKMENLPEYGHNGWVPQ